MPSREEVLAFIASQTGRVGKREISRHFGLHGADKVALKHLLKDIVDEGLVAKGRGKLVKHGALPQVVVVDVITRDADGDLVGTPAEWDEEEHGPAPSILIALPHRPRPGDPIPGLGDRALVRLSDGGGPSDDPRPVGRVMKILDRGRARTIGVFRAVPGHGGRLLPIDKKNVGRELAIPEEAIGEARDGDLVAVDIVRTSRFGPPVARVRERLGNLKSERAVSLIALEVHGIPHVFRADTLAEAERAEPVGLGRREDWRKLPLVTIDPPDAKDHDDAVHAEPDTSGDNPGGFILTIAIADVAAYVRPGTALDREAAVRGNSVYFPDRVVPMLPERISNDLCSLRPREDRPAMACRVVIRADGRRKSHSFHRIMMRSAAKLAYAQAQAAIDGHTDETTEMLLEPVLKPLWEAYAALKRARDDREPLDLDLPERKILLKPDGTVDRVVVPQRLDAHRLIEEMMILANVCAAETLEKHRTPCMYRIHDAPSMEKLMTLKEFLKSVDISLPKAALLRPSHFNQILSRAAEGDSAAVVNQVVLRSQSQAEYSPENIGHFGLALRRYAHFTSPIRRYADLIVHRGLIKALGLGQDGLTDGQASALAEIGAEISAAERRAMAAERETIDRLIAAHLSERVGDIFAGRIAGLTRSGLFVKLDETGADGFVPAATIGGDYYRFDEGLQALVGTRTGESWRLGDPVTVRLVEAAPVAGALRFELMSDGRSDLVGSRPSAHKGRRRDDGFTNGRRARPGDKPAKPPWKKKGRR
ncbi:ribonuclease R [Phreatobacter oligotrophus]|uniref:Ribonuclease R n=1 Tax=Phreatobacter oligotrophus TaxID=1122261 RepID=A0A2T4Z613_9HYPH|nr:ribonuclease R [Phreatobacter oligotrophus]PTM57325.1 RNAse R [Phreatobacter oligotrophus]